jgi:HTH-type transcriptional regulator/antitoxin HigA
MKPKILKNETEYNAALKRVDLLMDAEPGTSEADDLELWSLLVEAYEARHYPVDPPDPVEAIKFRMEQLGLQQKDLTRFIPAKSKVSEVMNRKRPLSLSMIRALHKHLGIPVEVLVEEPKGPYAVKKAGKQR